jgi:tetratricopeptide (TPR) repeat protein
MTRYATATAYAALADAKLGNASAAFDEAEEAIRYTSGSAKSWNLYASAMSLLNRPPKAVAAARNAVAIASRQTDKLDLAVYQYSLASALIEIGDQDEAEQLLRTVTTSLRSAGFEPLRRNIARSESFEVYSSARGDEQAYLALLNRAGLRLARLLESKGDESGARVEYERVLETRTDDPTALAALARVSPKYFDAAFEANPFSMTLIR